MNTFNIEIFTFVFIHQNRNDAELNLPVDTLKYLDKHVLCERIEFNRLQAVKKLKSMLNIQHVSFVLKSVDCS